MGCDNRSGQLSREDTISIHAARMGCDNFRSNYITTGRYFNPRSPNGLRPHASGEWQITKVISIHAARMGCDLCGVIRPEFYLVDFNPRSPNGLRLRCQKTCTKKTKFQSTQPEWAATIISAHFTQIFKFQSTQPEWAATRANLAKIHAIVISIHAARMGCDRIKPTATLW